MLGTFFLLISGLFLSSCSLHHLRVRVRWVLLSLRMWTALEADRSRVWWCIMLQVIWLFSDLVLYSDAPWVATYFLIQILIRLVLVLTSCPITSTFPFLSAFAPMTFTLLLLPKFRQFQLLQPRSTLRYLTHLVSSELVLGQLLQQDDWVGSRTLRHGVWW